jgi:hypothetical protein
MNKKGKKEGKEGKEELEYWSEKAQLQYNSLVDTFDEPSGLFLKLSEDDEGFAFWDKKTLHERGWIVFTRVELKNDLIYFTIDYEVKQGKLIDMFEVSESITYERLEQRVKVSGEDIITALVTLSFALKVANSDFTIDDVEKARLAMRNKTINTDTILKEIKDYIIESTKRTEEEDITSFNDQDLITEDNET